MGPFSWVFTVGVRCWEFKRKRKNTHHTVSLGRVLMSVCFGLGGLRRLAVRQTLSTQWETLTSVDIVRNSHRSGWGGLRKKPTWDGVCDFVSPPCSAALEHDSHTLLHIKRSHIRENSLSNKNMCLQPGVEKKVRLFLLAPFVRKCVPKRTVLGILPFVMSQRAFIPHLG